MKTIAHVPIMKTGEYQISTGMVNFTKSDLESAVAALSDKGVKEARIAIGHTDGRFDGEPAFGKVTNYSLENKGHTLYGDLVGVPDWLAAVMPTVFPNRSIEGLFDFRSTIGSKEHQFVITRLSLLGVALPGISTLEDLEVAITGDPEYVLIDNPAELVGPRAVAVFVDGEPMKKKAVAATMTVEDVRRAFYDQVASKNPNLWAREIQVDPQQIIANDEDEGDTYRIPYAAGADGKPEFADPVKVDIVYQDVAASEHAMKLAYASGTVFASKAESRPDEGEQVDNKELRASLGLAEDATDKEVRRVLAAAAEALKASTDEDEDDDTDEDEDDDDEDETDAEAEAAAEAAKVAAAARTKVKVKKGTKAKVAAAAAAPVEGTVVVDLAAFNSLKAAAARVDENEKQTKVAAAKGFVAASIKAGKIAPASGEWWGAQYTADPEGTEAIMASMAEVVPVTERGTGVHDGAEGGEAGGPAYDPTWLRPAEQKRLAAAAAGEYEPLLAAGTIMRER